MTVTADHDTPPRFHGVRRWLSSWFRKEPAPLQFGQQPISPLGRRLLAINIVNTNLGSALS